MAVYFHGSFGLKRSRLSAILKLGLEKPSLEDRDLAAPFGYGAPFASKYRSWLHKCGLTKRKRPIRLTPIGEIVWTEDPNLETTVTKWLLHWQLVQDTQRAEAWHYFYYKFLPRNGSSFSRDDLLAGLIGQFRLHSETHFGPGGKLTPVIVRKLLECYTEEYALGALGIVRKEGNRYRQEMRTVEGPWEGPSDLAKAYP